eukprot:3463608-Prymnesium_polylepis.4
MLRPSLGMLLACDAIALRPARPCLTKSRPPYAWSGYNQPSEGQSMCTRCAIGHYQPDIGTAGCLISPRGRYVQQAGANTSLECAAGVAMHRHAEWGDPSRRTRREWAIVEPAYT